MRVNKYQNWGRVVLHQNGGVTSISLTDEAGDLLRMRDIEVPTDSIPCEFRSIGSRFLFEWSAVWPEETDTPEDLRVYVQNSFRILNTDK